MDAFTFGTDSDSIQSIIGLLLTFTPIKSPSLAYTPKGREGFLCLRSDPALNGCNIYDLEKFSVSGVGLCDVKEQSRNATK